MTFCLVKSCQNLCNKMEKPEEDEDEQETKTDEHKVIIFVINYVIWYYNIYICNYIIWFIDFCSWKSLLSVRQSWKC